MRHRFACILTLLFVAACRDSTGPDGDARAGRRVLKDTEYSTWMWLPEGDEILFSTPFDYPYTGPPARLNAVDVATGRRRSVVPPFGDGRQIIGRRFSVQGSHVYFEVSTAPDRVALYRAPLNGSSTPTAVLDSGAYGMTVSPDERTVAWIEWGRKLVLADVATAERRGFPLEESASRVTWSPSGASLVADDPLAWSSSGNPFYWLDLSTGTMRRWVGSSDELVFESTRHVTWDGESPLVLVVHRAVTRYAIETGAREVLAPLAGAWAAVGWTADYGTVFLAQHYCMESSNGIFGSDCRTWSSTIDRLDLSSRTQTNILRHQGPAAIGGAVSPAASWLAYDYFDCGGGCQSLYVLRLD